MSVFASLSPSLLEDVASWRRDLHQHPELGYEEWRTSARVAELLRSFGCDSVETEIGGTGVVGLIEGRRPTQSPRTIGLRADMDALLIVEETNLPYTSKTKGVMHACGHDGHTSMLLGASKILCDTRDFAGRVAVIFQPAEEGGAGAKAMLEAGLKERFALSAVFGLHNMPNRALGTFGIRAGSIMAAADRFQIIVHGKGGHAAKPSNCLDPVVVAAHIITALQNIVARGVDPLESAVVTVAAVHAGEAFNVIPQTATLLGTVRTLKADVRDFCERRLKLLAEHTAQAFGLHAEVVYTRGYPVTRNHAAETALVVQAAEAIVGADAVESDAPPLMGAEDFAYMLEEIPGAYIFMGNGTSAGLHHPAYDFNDAAIPYGIAYWISVVKTFCELTTA
jgi:amidohydrolase